MKCKHSMTWNARWSGSEWIYPGFNEVGRRKCATCGKWLSLGPANDDDERVKVEIEAAHVAKLAITEAGARMMSKHEKLGYTAFVFDDRYRGEWHDTPAFRAGYLAAAIAAHEEAE